MKLGIHPPYGTELKQNIDYCVQAKVHYVGLGRGHFEMTDPLGIPTFTQLDLARVAYSKDDIMIYCYTPAYASLEALKDEAEMERETGMLRELITRLGAAGIPALHFYSTRPLASAFDDEREELRWKLVEYYRRIVPVAERAQVKIATHPSCMRPVVLDSYHRLAWLIEQVPSEYNGFLLCNGMAYLAGDEPADVIRKYPDKIFLVHMRDMVGRHARFQEVLLGEGEVDLAEVFRSLYEIDFQGVVFPEHYPAIAGDRAKGTVWNYGYMKGMADALKPNR